MDITKIKTFLDNQEVQAPEELSKLKLLATFDNDSTQANIEAQSLTFTGTGKAIIDNHLEQGYFFESLPLQFQIRKGDRQIMGFEGMLEMNNDFEATTTDRVIGKMQKLDGLNTLNERLSALTFGLLDSENLVKKVNLEYLVEKRKPITEIIVSGFLIYSLLDTISETIRKSAELIGEIAAFSSQVPTGTIGAAILLAAKLAANIVYTATLIKLTYDLVKDLIFSFISPVRKYPVASYRSLMTAAATKLGYGFSSTISYLDNAHYLASNPYRDEVQGIPSPSDAGNNCGQFFSIMQRMFAAKTAIVDGVIHFENKDSDFWLKDSTFKMPSTLKSTTRNGGDLVGVRVVSWSTDTADEYTLQELGNTNHFEVRTDQKEYKNDVKYLNIKGVDDRLMPFARVARKNSLSELESTIKVLADVADSVIKVFGGNSNLASSIKDRVGMAKLSTDSHTVPRMVYLEGGKIPRNFESLTSAEYFYFNFIKAESFILSVNGGPMDVFTGIKIPFGFDDFLSLINNSYFVSDNGSKGRVDKLIWDSYEDSAVVDYRVQNDYTNGKLKETYLRYD